MSTLLATPRRPEAADAPRYWTTAEFDRLVGQGILEEGSKTYLWEGQIVEPMPEYQPHWNAFINLYDLFKPLFPAADWLVGPNATVAIEDGTKPQPDLVVAQGPRARYRFDPPAPADISLVVEISYSTYPRDSGERLRKYAKVEIPFFWIIDIPARRVEVYEVPRAPDDGAPFYEKRSDFGIGQRVPFHVSHGGAVVIGEVAVVDILRDSLEQADDEA